ncbi:hypothetical protein EKQ61_08870 [Staphylococcus gallinarum]|uniref:hypothetical protein n=1 Tax=Staphylococcus gallinarum TaxID=1293 RepID=UPI0009E2A72C|nr:hypothetical protein [Staphylococcus gallinarum]RTX76309.1 hypothetical protein EKQ61_08870 [Staphylococcus gallinarum]UEH02103.1 hypothetical protein K3U27_01060 [Staphylococcus gallinarum]
MYLCAFLIFKYYVLLSRFPRGQLQPVVFSLSCSHRSLAKIRLKNYDFTLKYFRVPILNV